MTLPSERVMEQKTLNENIVLFHYKGVGGMRVGDRYGFDMEMTNGSFGPICLDH